MEQYIPKSAVVAEIDRIYRQYEKQVNSEYMSTADFMCIELKKFLSFIDTLEVIDPYELYIQYPSVKDAIQAHAEIYSFNIESELFNQLTKEQQKLWRKEIEEACISGGNVGVELVRDIRYKENVETKEMDLEKELNKWRNAHFHKNRNGASGEYLTHESQLDVTRHFFELGLKVQKGENI